jgi:hypothetical protein
LGFRQVESLLEQGSAIHLGKFQRADFQLGQLAQVAGQTAEPQGLRVNAGDDFAAQVLVGSGGQVGQPGADGSEGVLQLVVQAAQKAAALVG